MRDDINICVIKCVFLCLDLLNLSHVKLEDSIVLKSVYLVSGNNERL